MGLARCNVRLLEHLENGGASPTRASGKCAAPSAALYVHSKVMAWVAFDRAVRAVERFGRDGPAERWRAQREEIRREVLREGFDPTRSTFTRAYGSRELDGALLMIGLVGFLPPDDERVRGTVDAIQRDLCEGSLVLRYRAGDGGDGLPGREGAFLPCSFWLVNNLALMGRTQEALALFERLRGLCNDVGLISEEYDPASGRLVGNFPQAFTHVGLVDERSRALRRRAPARASNGSRAGRDVKIIAVRAAREPARKDGLIARGERSVRSSVARRRASPGPRGRSATRSGDSERSRLAPDPLRAISLVQPSTDGAIASTARLESWPWRRATRPCWTCSAR